MKKTLLFIATLLTIGLWSCQSDNPPRYQVKDLLGTHDGPRIELTYNGEKVENPYFCIVDPANDEEGICKFYNLDLDPQYKYVILPAYYTPYGKGNNDFLTIPEKSYFYGCDFAFDNVVIPIEITQNSDELLFEGTYTQPDSEYGSITHTIKGRLAPNHIKLDVLSAEYTRRIGNCKLVGKTFELKIDKDHFYPHVYTNKLVDFQGKQRSSAELCEEYFDLLRKNFVENTGGDAIRFTFNADGTVTFSYPQKNGVDHSDTSVFYVGNFKELFIRQSQSSVRKLLNNFAAPGKKSESNGLYCSKIENIPLMLLDFELINNELSLYPTVIPTEYKPEFLEQNIFFVRAWHFYGDTDNSYGSQLGGAIEHYAWEGTLTFNPVFKAVCVNP